jgi:hypothetical protein
MHIGGMGDTNRLAAGVKAVYDRIAQVRAAQNMPVSNFPGDIATPSSVSAAPIEQILGTKVQSKDGMVKVSIGRPAKMRGEGINIVAIHQHMTHDASLHVPALLGQGQGGRPGQGGQEGVGCSARGEVVVP